MLSKQKKKYYSWDMAQLCCLYVHMQEKGFEKITVQQKETENLNIYRLPEQQLACGSHLLPHVESCLLPGVWVSPQVDSPAPPCTSLSAQRGHGACPR